MDLHPSSLPVLGRDALGPQWTYPTYRLIKLESLQSVDAPRAVSPLSRWHDGAGNLPRRTGATARRQVKVKVILGKMFPVGPARRFGHQLPSRLGESLAGATITVGRIAHGFRHHRAGTRFALLHQFQCPRLSGALPGNTSTAVISWRSVSTTMAAWCPWRSSGSCTDGIRSRLTPSLRLTPSSTSPAPLWRSMSWSSNCPSNSAPATMLCRWTLSSGNSTHAGRNSSSSRSASATISPKSFRRALRSDQSIVASPLMLEPRYFSYPWASAHSPTAILATAARARNSLTIPSASRLQVSCTAPRPRMQVVSSATRIPRFFR